MSESKHVKMPHLSKSHVPAHMCVCFQILHKHFSAWYNVVLERRLKMGKARATSDWKLLLRAWNAWRSYVRGRTMEKESRQVEQDIIETHR